MAACARRAVQRRRDCCVCCETGLPKGGEEGLLWFVARRTLPGAGVAGAGDASWTADTFSMSSMVSIAGAGRRTIRTTAKAALSEIKLQEKNSCFRLRALSP